MFSPPTFQRHAATPWGHLLLCALAGLLQALAAGWTVVGTPGEAVVIDQPRLAEMAWLIHLLVAGIVFHCLVRPSAAPLKHALLCSAAFGLCWQVAATSWIYVGMHRYAGLAGPLSAAAVFALGAYLAGFTVVTCLAFRVAYSKLVGARGSMDGAAAVAAGAAAFSGSWLLSDLGRAMVFSGFPWASSGYAHVQGPFRHLLPWIGIYGAAAVAAGAAALLVQLLRTGLAAHRWRLLLAAGVMGACSALLVLPTRDFTTGAGEFEVSLLQGNVSQDKKFQAEQIPQTLAWYTRQLVRSSADVVMTPETAWPVAVTPEALLYGSSLEQRIKADRGVLLLGMPRTVSPGIYRNSLLGLGHEQTLMNASDDGRYHYEKQHLVPFAEYTPTGFAWFTRLLNLPLPSFETAAAPSAPLRIRSRSGPVQVIAPLICFEDLFGEDFAPLFVHPQEAPTAFANASNLAWFDASPAMAQHLRIARARSLEFQRPTFRATNTGPTVVINHLGQVTRALAPLTAGVLHAVVEGRHGITPYAYWLGRWGLWPLALAGLALLLAPALLGSRTDERSPGSR